MTQHHVKADVADDAAIDFDLWGIDGKTPAKANTRVVL